MRRHWIDNLRWVTVLLVLLYHVIYFYNNKGVFGGIGGFGDGPQYQDIIMYVLYPWFMPMLFLLAGISARYALEKHSPKEWFKARTRKLLVPSTIGLFFFGVFIGWFGAQTAPEPSLEALPMPIKYIIWSISGIGPLWFIQDLWLLSIVILIVRRLDSKDRLYNACGKAGVTAIILIGVLLYLGHQTLIQKPAPLTTEGLRNLYKPQFYLIPFLTGYFVFSHERVQNIVGKLWISLMATASVAGIILIISTFGQDCTSPEYLGAPLTNIYGWLMCLAMMGWFKACFDRTDRFATYMTRSSYGIYIVHYLIIVSLGSYLKLKTQLSPLCIYPILTVAVFTLSPLLYEIIRRIPFLRWCILGEKRTKTER